MVFFFSRSTGPNLESFSRLQFFKVKKLVFPEVDSLSDNPEAMTKACEFGDEGYLYGWLYQRL